ncbi:MAG: outer membrane beta-barrel protein, partial [Gammaproteobacteria bacterium]|nr:outer membrane beta-barrel protein [Gammaproteobacteria bacterium]
DMAYDWTTSSSISFNGSVGYDRSYFGAENLGFNPYYEVEGSITHLLGRRLSGSLVAGYRRNLYIDEDPDREDATWRAGVGLAYQAQPWLRFNLDYLYNEVDSNINTNDYTENRGMITVTLTPRQPVRF